MQRAVLLSQSELILPEHLPAKVRAAASQPLPVSAGAGQLDEIEREAILQALRKHEFNRTETAKALGISRRTLLYKLQNLRQLGFQTDLQTP
jgi:DNA-binding NtrC family response regulator